MAMVALATLSSVPPARLPHWDQPIPGMKASAAAQGMPGRRRCGGTARAQRATPAWACCTRGHEHGTTTAPRRRRTARQLSRASCAPSAAAVQVWAAGFGITETGQSSNRLRYTTLTVLESGECPQG